MLAVCVPHIVGTFSQKNAIWDILGVMLCGVARLPNGPWMTSQLQMTLCQLHDDWQPRDSSSIWSNTRAFISYLVAFTSVLSSPVSDVYMNLGKRILFLPDAVWIFLTASHFLILYCLFGKTYNVGRNVGRFFYTNEKTWV